MGSHPTIDHAFLVELAARGLVKPTFVRLDEERRAQVIDAVLSRSARSGPERVNIKEVAAAAGVPVGSLYQYFGDRDNLARFAALSLARELSRELEACYAYLGDLPLREALRAYLSYGIEWSENKAASLRSFVAAAYREAPAGSAFDGEGPEADGSDGWYVETLIRPVARAMQDLVLRLFAAARSRGELRDDIDEEATARLANVLLIAAGDARMMSRLDEYYRLYGPGVSSERRIEEVVDFICRAALRAEESP